MKTKVEVLGFTTEGLTIVQLFNSNYDAIVLYNEDTLEVERELNHVEYFLMDKEESHNDQLGSVSKGIVTDWFEALVDTL